MKAARRIFIAALLALAACSSRSPLVTASTDAGTVPETCEQYLEQYRSCMVRLGQPPEAVEGRMARSREQMRAGDPLQLKTRCASDLTQLRAACP